jgi:hypothetical protein
MSVTASRNATRGVVFIHSTPTCVVPAHHLGPGTVLGQPLHLEWTIQPAGPRMVRTEVSWSGDPGTGARLASALRGWDHVRYEVTEDPSPGADGSRWSHTPTLGLHHTWTSANGDAMVNEDRLRDVVDLHRGDVPALHAAIDALLGAPWDRELEPFRYAGDGAPVRWLHKVG